jgi:hypothetical protein
MGYKAVYGRCKAHLKLAVFSNLPAEVDPLFGTLDTTSITDQFVQICKTCCTLFDMQVNVSPHKTCIVVYGTPAGNLPVWTLGGTVVPVCNGYTDLGVQCTAAWGFQDGAVALAVAGRRAMHAALSMCKRGKLVQPAFKLRLFDALV